jgi:hypothetical protein
MSHYPTLGLDPRCEIVGVREVAHRTLLRTRLGSRTQRYVSCHEDHTKRFRFFRRITTSERKRATMSNLKPSPLELLSWVRVEGGTWTCQLGGKPLTPLIPSECIAPTDYNVYLWGTQLLGAKRLKGIVNEKQYTE